MFVRESLTFISIQMGVELALPFVFFLLIRVETSIGVEFVYNGFGTNDLHLDGIAEIAPNGLLKMTNTTKNEQGHAFLPSPLDLKNSSDGTIYSFSTQFAFAIVSEYSDISTHGIALVLSPTRGRPGALPIQYLGLFNSSNNGNSSNHVVAVELDTIYNVEFGDIDNNHVGIDINGLRSSAAAPASYFTSSSQKVENLSLCSGDPMQVWVEYGSQDMKLNVTVSPIDEPKPAIPLLSLSSDLSSVIDDEMYIGFSAASGSVTNSHYILGWSFKLNGKAPPLNLTSLPSLPPRIEAGKKNKNLLIWVPLLAVVLIMAALCGVVYVIKRKMKFSEVLEDWELEYRPHRFSYKELYKATMAFREENLLGIGGFGRVYKGTLSKSKMEVAVKRVSHDSRQGMREFIAEIVSIGRLRHRNLVRLLGYCRRRGELLLVYEFMPNGSLDKYLFNNTRPATLNWRQRLQIIKGVASGVFYLHEEWEQVVVHRDIKASNVLLDAEMNAKLGDFGLSRLYNHGSDPRSTHIIGTLGYIAPEVTRTGRATTCTDVFAFGVFLLEVVSGRRPILHEASTDVLNLVDWAWRCWRRGAILETMDVKLGTDFEIDQVQLVLKLGLLCSHPVPASRPTMRQVIHLLNGDLSISIDDIGNASVSSRGNVEAFDIVSLSYPSTNLSSSFITSLFGKSTSPESLRHGDI